MFKPNINYTHQVNDSCCYKEVNFKPKMYLKGLQETIIQTDGSCEVDI